ncbi:MAG: ABC transporter ATP-binding protein [Nitrospiraceae bacterium]
MHDGIAIKMVGVAKMYKVFPSRTENFLDAIGVPSWRGGAKKRYKEFWALKGIDLSLPIGSRIGILGRNGAGKSTLLKLITGNLSPTEGIVEVNGRIQALLEAGAGFHPEFTGYENIHASLTCQGLSSGDIADAVDEIVDFTELGDFLAQPYRTYSAGMQARLAFATATAIRPEILIIDEMLGAGDAYFLGKSAERIRALVTGGASVLLVSHALDQIVKLCDQAIWIERGKMVHRGPSLEVVKEYERYIRLLEDERLKAKNRAVERAGQSSVRDDEAQETLIVEFASPAKVECQVSEVALLKGDSTAVNVLVGDAQDVNAVHLAYVKLEGSDWSDPGEAQGTFYRSVIGYDGGERGAQVICRVFHLYVEERYRCRIRYRIHGDGHAVVTVKHKGVAHGQSALSGPSKDWSVLEFELEPFQQQGGAVEAALPGPGTSPVSHGLSGTACKVSRWPGEGSLAIAAVRLVNAQGGEQAVFQADAVMRVRLSFIAKGTAVYPIIPVAVLFRLDGVIVSTHIGRAQSLSLAAGEQRTVVLDYGEVRLGNGRYVFSVALYRQLSAVGPTEVYDLLDRSYEFAVEGNPPLESGIVRHQATWSLL